jgi:DNA-binding transcriptional LysR family regulator
MVMVPWQQSVTLHHLRVYLAVARHRNYTHAAEELYLSQPSVSAQVHELERLVGVPLFEQVGKRLLPTQAGQLLEAHARTVLAAVDEAAIALARLQRLETGRLLVTASTTVGSYVLPKVLGAFHARYPGVEVMLEVKNSEEVCEDVRQGYTELGLIESPAEQVGDDLQLSPFRDDALVVIVPPWHPWAGLAEVPISALAEGTLLWREPGSGTRSIIEAALQKARIRPRAIIQLGSTEAIKQAVAANVGISVLSQAAVSAEVAAGWLITLRCSGIPPQRTFYLVKRRAEHASPIVEAFLRLLLGEQESKAPDAE